MADDNDEEDFFSMLTKDDAEAPPLIKAPERLSATAELDGDFKGQNPLVAPDPMYHHMASDSEHELEESSPVAAPRSVTEFEEILAEFYAKHNFGNLDKVPYLAEKFTDRRWELWEQLSIKYKLSPSESRTLWIRFHIQSDGVSECARKLFKLDGTVTIPDDSMLLRKAAWRRILCVNADDDTQRVLYHKYADEIAPRERIEKLSPETSDIVRDVLRTHQELAFFHEASVMHSMTEILTVYTLINGVPYVQGMNEILGIIFYVMRDESDSFWAFSMVMSQMHDLFTAEADSTRDGIYSHIDSLMGLLRSYDYNLWKHLVQIEFPVTTLAMRWITTVLAMDLTLPDTMRLWDISLQSSNSNHLLFFSVILSLSYLLSLSTLLMGFSDGQDAIEFASRFGKGVDFDVEHVLVVALSVYAFESVLRGRYPASSEEPVLDALLDAMGSAKHRVVETIGNSDIQKTRAQLLSSMSNVKHTMTGWIGKVVANMPTLPEDNPVRRTLADTNGEHDNEDVSTLRF